MAELIVIEVRGYLNLPLSIMTSFLQNPLLRVLPLVKRLVKSGPSTSSSQILQTANPESFYQLSSQLQTGQNFSFDTLKGKQVLLVNTDANLTDSAQYRELQQLAEQFADELVVLAFPTSDFPAPEQPAGPVSTPGTAVIHLMQPSAVVKTAQQHPVYQWLSTARQNGWNEQAPPRPFTKYLVNAAGQLAHYFGPTLSPLSDTVIESIQNPLT